MLAIAFTMATTAAATTMATAAAVVAAAVTAASIRGVAKLVAAKKRPLFRLILARAREGETDDCRRATICAPFFVCFFVATIEPMSVALIEPQIRGC